MRRIREYVAPALAFLALAGIATAVWYLWPALRTPRTMAYLLTFGGGIGFALIIAGVVGAYISRRRDAGRRDSFTMGFLFGLRTRPGAVPLNILRQRRRLDQEDPDHHKLDQALDAALDSQKPKAAA